MPIKRIARAFGWFCVGLAGTLVIGLGTLSVIPYRMPVKMIGSRSVYTGAWDRGYVVAKGTWTIDEAKQAFPLQLSKIQCYRDDRMCTAAQAEIVDGNVLHLETYRYDVRRWDAEAIQYVTETPCVSYLYTITRGNERIVGTRTTKPDGDAGCQVVAR